MDTTSANPVNQPATNQSTPDVSATNYVLFDHHLCQLFTHLQEVIKSRHGVKIRTGDPPVEYFCLNRYISLYNKMQPKEHIGYFELAFARNRLGILAYPDTKWLSEGTIVIQLGEGTMKVISPEVQVIKILLTDIYKMALELKKNAAENLSDANSTDPDLTLHDSILLQLYRIFYVFAQGNDSPRIHTFVSTLEEKLKIPAEQRTPFRRPDGQPPSGIFTLAIDMVERILPVPKGMRDRLPSDGQVLKSIDQVVNHQTTQAVIGGVLGPVKEQLQFGQLNIAQAMGTVFENIQKPELQSQMKDVLLQTIETSKNHGVSEEQVEKMKQQTESFVQTMPPANMLFQALSTLPQHLRDNMAQQAGPPQAPVIYDD